MARLNALPYATHCIKCQRELERLGEDDNSYSDWSRLPDVHGDVDISINDLELDVS